MRFRKLVMCMVAGILLCAFPSIHTYATEEVTVNTEPVEASETETKETDGITKVTNVIEMANELAVAEANETALAEEEKEETNTEENTVTTKIDNKEVVEKETTEKETADKKAVDKKEAKEKKEEKKKYSEADLRLLSALIFCEAQGESYRGKVAVGIVVMNRVRSALFPDTIKGVIYQSYQFSPARNGSLDRALAEYDKGNFTSEAEKDCIKAAKEVLNGKTTITIDGKEVDFSKYLFFSARLKGYTLRIGNHQFK